MVHYGKQNESNSIPLLPISEMWLTLINHNLPKDTEILSDVLLTRKKKKEAA